MFIISYYLVHLPEKADFFKFTNTKYISVSGLDCYLILTWEIFRGIFADSEAGGRAASHSEVSHWSPRFSAKQKYKNSLPLHGNTSLTKTEKKRRSCLCVTVSVWVRWRGGRGKREGTIIFVLFTSRARIFKLLGSPGIESKGNDSASLCSLAGRYDNPIPTQFLAPIDCSKIPALALLPAICMLIAEALFSFMF